MNQRTIYASKIDFDRLTDLTRSNRRPADQPYVRELRAELERAKVVDPRKIPADVVTMNTRVLLEDVASGEESTYTIVYPADANIDEDKISVLAPIGTAILGYRKGATVTWNVPGGERKLLIKDILYQPESAGDFHL